MAREIRKKSTEVVSHDFRGEKKKKKSHTVGETITPPHPVSPARVNHVRRVCLLFFFRPPLCARLSLYPPGDPATGDTDTRDRQVVIGCTWAFLVPVRILRTRPGVHDPAYRSRDRDVTVCFRVRYSSGAARATRRAADGRAKKKPTRRYNFSGGFEGRGGGEINRKRKRKKKSKRERE